MHPVLYRPLVTNAIATRTAVVTTAKAQAAKPSASPAGHPILVAATPSTAVHLQAPVVAAAARTGAPTPIVMRAPPVETVPPPRVSTPVVIRSDVMALHVQELGQQSTPQTVTSNNFKLSFDYCLVEAKREWVSGSFLTARNWYVPHTKACDLASLGMCLIPRLARSQASPVRAAGRSRYCRWPRSSCRTSSSRLIGRTTTQ